MFNLIASLDNYTTVAVEVRKRYSNLQVRQIMSELNVNVINRISEYINFELNNKLVNFPTSLDKDRKAFVTELVQLLNIFITIPKVRKEKDELVYSNIVNEWSNTVRDFVEVVKTKYNLEENFRPDMVQFLLECQDEIEMIVFNEFFTRFLPDRKDLNPLDNFEIKT